MVACCVLSDHQNLHGRRESVAQGVVDEFVHAIQTILASPSLMISF